MKKTIQTSLMAILLLSLFAFTGASTSKLIGVYGVSKNDPSAIELTIHEDKTFTYRDFSNPSKKIDVNGNWELKNKHIYLINVTSDYSFHSKWKIVKDGMVAKSRKGLTFYRLSKQ